MAEKSLAGQAQSVPGAWPTSPPGPGGGRAGWDVGLGAGAGPDADAGPVQTGPVLTGPVLTGPVQSGGPTARPRILPARAAWWAVPGAALGVVLAGVGATIGQVVTGSAKSATTDLLGEAGLWLAMLATAVFVSNRYGSASLRRDFGLSIKAKDPLWGLLAAVSAVVVAQGVLLAFNSTRFAGSNDEVLTQQQGHALGLVVVALIVAFGAPFFEELFFRGLLRTTLQARFGAHGAIWLQAALFGLAHTGEATTTLGNVSVVLAMFCVGAVLGYTAKLTGRLGPGMVAHCLFNLLAVVTVL